MSYTPVQLLAYRAIQDNIYPGVPGTGASVVTDPAMIMLAYNYAADSARNRRHRLAAHAARRNWIADYHDLAEGIASGALAHDPRAPSWELACARARAREQGPEVEGVLLGALGEIAASDAVEKAVEATGEQATPEDESYLTWAWRRMMAAGEFNVQMLQTLMANSPSAVAQRAVQEMGTAWKETVRSEMAKNRDWAGEQLDKSRQTAEKIVPVIAENVARPLTAAATAGMIMTGIVALGAIMWLLPRAK